MPELVELQKELGPDGLRVVAVSMDHISPAGEPLTARAIDAFVEARGFAGLEHVLYDGDPGALIDGPWDLPGFLPFSVVLDAEGRVVERVEGGTSLAAAKRLVSPLLGR